MFKTKKTSPQRKRSSVGSARVHSYYTPSQQERIDIDMSSRRSEKRSSTLRTVRQRVERIAGVVFAVFILYMLISLRGTPLILVSPNTVGLNEQRYSAKVNELFDASILNSNKLTLQKGTIASTLLEEYPELSSVEVRYSFVGRRPEVYIRTYTLPFSYESLGAQYLINEVGRNVGLLTQLPAQTVSLKVKDESGVQTKKGDFVLRSGDVSFMTTAKSLLAQKGRRTEFMRLTSVPREVYIKLADTSYEVRMYLEEDPQLQVGTFLAAEKTLGEGGTVPTQYMDVRAGEKVFWQ